MTFAFCATATGEEWERWRRHNATLTDGAVSLRAEPFPAYADPVPVVKAADPAVVAMDINECGDLYLLRADGEIDRYDTEADALRPLECDGIDRSGADPRVLLVTRRTIYVGDVVAADERDADADTGTESDGGDGESENSGDGGSEGDATGAAPLGRLVAITKHLRQTRWVTDTLGAVPVALAEHDERVYGLFASGDGNDRAADGTSGGGESLTAGGGVLTLVTPGGTVRPLVRGFRDPLDLAVGDDGRAYVLDGGGDGTLYRIDLAGLDPAAPESAPAPWGPSLPTAATCLAADGDGDLLLGTSPAVNGLPTLHRVRPRTTAPLGSFGRDCRRLRLVAGGLYALEDDGVTVHHLTAVRRFAADPENGTYAGTVTGVFDAGAEATEWHRVELGFDDADPGTRVTLRYAASEDRQFAGGVDWVAFDRANPHDVLLADAVGRYLRLELTLHGTERATPSLRSVRAYFPRQSYLRHLPAVYQRDAESRDFLERFLSVFETTFVGVEEDLAELTRFLDARGIPAAFLGWLESWLALSTDETWPEDARRELLERAPALFRSRGTPNGLLALLGIYVGAVAEHPRSWQSLIDRQVAAVDDREARGDLDAEEADELRALIRSDLTLLEYADLDCASGGAREAFTALLPCPQCFFVFVRSFVTDEQLRTVQRLVDEHRPTHAVGTAVRLEPSVVLGGHSYLGVNSVLPDRDLVVGDTALGRDTVLDTRDPLGQLGVRSRLAEDTRLS